MYRNFWQEGCTCDSWHSAPVSRSEGKKSRSSGRLTPRPKISHTFGIGRPTNFKLGTGWSTLTRITGMRGDLKGHLAHIMEQWHAQWPLSWKFCVSVQVTTCRRRGTLWRLHYATGRTASFWRIYYTGFTRVNFLLDTHWKCHYPLPAES